MTKSQTKTLEMIRTAGTMTRTECPKGFNIASAYKLAEMGLIRIDYVEVECKQTFSGFASVAVFVAL